MTDKTLDRLYEWARSQTEDHKARLEADAWILDHMKWHNLEG